MYRNFNRLLTSVIPKDNVQNVLKFSDLSLNRGFNVSCLFLNEIE